MRSTIKLGHFERNPSLYAWQRQIRGNEWNVKKIKILRCRRSISMFALSIFPDFVPCHFLQSSFTFNKRLGFIENNSKTRSFRTRLRRYSVITNRTKQKVSVGMENRTIETSLSYLNTHSIFPLRFSNFDSSFDTFHRAFEVITDYWK